MWGTRSSRPESPWAKRDDLECRVVKDQPSDAMPSTRLARSARLGGLAAGQAARYAGTATANVARRPEGRKIALDRRHLAAADQILSVLGTMKGPAMKLGQLLSFVDLGIIPEDVRPKFQERLATLCDSAPPLPISIMTPVLERELGGSLSDVFASLDPAPIGTASIGQVYRAKMHDGRDVAVKIQYPKMAAAAAADLKNLAFALRRATQLIPGADTVQLAAQLTEALKQELDYAQEASVHRQIAANFAGHPFIKVPKVVDELCGPRVLVTEFIDGMDFDQACASDQELRNRTGEIIVRFYLGSLLRNDQFSGDPHPGNIKTLPDGTVAFLDFGSSARVDPDKLDVMKSVFQAVKSHDGASAKQGLLEAGLLNAPERVTDDEVLAFVTDAAGLFFVDDGVRFEPRMASDAVLISFAPTSKYGQSLRGQQMSTEWLSMARTMVSSTALLGQLGAQANWHTLALELLGLGPPATPLGIAEAEFLAR